jgi:hypothetical protein
LIDRARVDIEPVEVLAPGVQPVMPTVNSIRVENRYQIEHELLAEKGRPRI